MATTYDEDSGGLVRRFRKRRGRRTRKLKHALVVLGAMGVLLGMLLTGLGAVKGVPKVRDLGAIYLLVSLAMLGVRQALHAARAQAIPQDPATDARRRTRSMR